MRGLGRKSSSLGVPVFFSSMLWEMLSIPPALQVFRRAGSLVVPATNLFFSSSGCRVGFWARRSAAAAVAWGAAMLVPSQLA